jgi:hypothetical protein
MAYPVVFDCRKVEKWLKALDEGRDMKCIGQGWSVQDMVALASVLLAGLISNGPVTYQQSRKLYDAMPAEHREASEENFEREQVTAIQFVPRVVLAVLDQKYFEQGYDSVVHAVVYRDGDEMTIRAVSGIKGTDAGR